MGAATLVRNTATVAKSPAWAVAWTSREGPRGRRSAKAPFLSVVTVVRGARVASRISSLVAIRTGTPGSAVPAASRTTPATVGGAAQGRAEFVLVGPVQARLG